MTRLVLRIPRCPSVAVYRAEPFAAALRRLVAVCRRQGYDHHTLATVLRSESARMEEEEDAERKARAAPEGPAGFG
jgi:hypothetical protein